MVSLAGPDIPQGVVTPIHTILTGILPHLYTKEGIELLCFLLYTI